MVFSASPTELILVGAAILFLILGPKKLPQFARSLGESKKEFKKSMAEADEVAEELDVSEEDGSDESEDEEE